MGFLSQTFASFPEFYHCLLLGVDIQQLNYEQRARDKALETDLYYTIERMQLLKTQLAAPLDG